MAKQHDEMKAKLESAGLAFDHVNVFGGCVHVQCVGRDTRQVFLIGVTA